MTARIQLGRVRYDALHNSSRNSPGGRVVVESGDRREELPFPSLAENESQSLGHSPFVFDGQVRVLVFETGVDAPVGQLVFSENPEEPDPHGNWPYKRIVQGDAQYTISYRVSLTERDTGALLEAGATGIQRCVLARNDWNCVTPTETAMIFHPLWKRRQLRDAEDKETAIPLGDPRRQQYSNAIAQEVLDHPDNKQPWRGEKGEGDVYNGFEIGGHRLIIRDPNDVGGSFEPGANRFRRYWGVPAGNVHQIDNGRNEALDLGHGHGYEGDAFGMTQRLNQVLQHFDEYQQRLEREEVEPLSAVAFFCHGWRRGFQLGLENMNTPAGGQGLEDLATRIKNVSREDVVVILYACSTAKEPHDGTNFAARLRDKLIAGALAKPYCRVVGHEIDGHAFHLPRLRFFEGTDGAGDAGQELAPPGDLRTRFGRYLSADPSREQPHPPHSGFAWAFPFMSLEAVQAFLALDNPPADAYAEPDP